MRIIMANSEGHGQATQTKYCWPGEPPSSWPMDTLGPARRGVKLPGGMYKYDAVPADLQIEDRYLVGGVSVLHVGKLTRLLLLEFCCCWNSAANSWNLLRCGPRCHARTTRNTEVNCIGSVLTTTTMHMLTAKSAKKVYQLDKGQTNREKVGGEGGAGALGRKIRCTCVAWWCLRVWDQ